jgi:hypothetical protein
MDMFPALLQANATLANISQFEFYLSLAGVLIAALVYIRLMKKDKVEAMEKKVDKVDFKEYQLVVNSRLSRKAEKEAMERLESDIWESLKSHEGGNNTAFKLMREDFIDMRKEFQAMNEKNSISQKQIVEVSNDVKWLVKHINGEFKSK